MAFTRLTPRWCIKRAMREIASFLAMTARAGGYSNLKLLVFLTLNLDSTINLMFREILFVNVFK